MTNSLRSAALLIPVLAVSGACRERGKQGDKSTVPAAAVVNHRVQESELTTIELSPQAVRRLGIQTARLEAKDVSRTRTYPGEVMLPPEQVQVVLAPAAGLIQLPPGGDSRLQSGARVSAGEPVLMLVPGASNDGELLAATDRISQARVKTDTMSARIDAQGQATSAQVQVDAAKVKLDRAEALHKGGAGSQRALDEARAEHGMAHAALTAASERLKTIDTVLAKLESGQPAAISILSPLSGQIRAVQVAPGQAIPGGAPMFEVARTDPVWVRVPVYVGDLGGLAIDDSVRVTGLADRPGASSVAGSRVHPPASADPGSTNQYLHYEIGNPDGQFQAGQRVAVVLNARDRQRAPVVPYSSVVLDMEGGSWVYEQTAENKYRRRRVAVRDVVDDLAVLAHGPEPGTPVVTQGAAELFGTEFGAGK